MLRSKMVRVGLCGALALVLSACAEEDDDVAVVTPPVVVSPSPTPTPVAAIDELEGVSTAVALDDEFLAGLTSLKLTPGVLGGASLEDGVVSFPITDGNVIYYDPNSGVQPYVQGSIEHEGSGISLTNGTKTVELEDFIVDPGESVLTGRVTVDGEVFAERAPLFFLDGRTLNPLQVNEDEGTAVLQGTSVSLTKTAADALNQVFATSALVEFFPVGVATITVELPDTDPTGAPAPAPTETVVSTSPSASPSVVVSVSPSASASPSASPSPSPVAASPSAAPSPS